MFQAAEKRCDECLFSPNAIVSDKRRKDVLRQCAKNDSHFICHKFSITDDGSQVCCRGFYDANPHAANLMRIAHRLDCVEFVPIPEVAKLHRIEEPAK